MQRRTKFLLGATAALAVVVGIPAIARDKPESLLPPGFGDPSTPPPPPVTSTPKPASSVPAQNGAPETDGVVETDTLSDADVPTAQVSTSQVEYPVSSRRNPAMAGVLDPQKLGIGSAPWGTINGQPLEILLKRMDAPLSSRWAHIGLRSALLAAVPAPRDIDPADWAAERAWLLLRMGEADGARMLVASVDSDRFTPRMKQVAIQSALATGDPAAMCGIPGDLSKLEPKVAPLIAAMCASLNGEPERASADIGAVRRRGQLPVIDIALADKVVGASAETSRAVTIEWEPVNSLNIWRFGLATSTALMPPARLMDAATPQMRSWLARSPMFQAADKLSSARIASALGVYSTQGLLDLYAAAYDATGPDELGATDAWQVRLAFVGRDREARLDAMRQLWGVNRTPYDREASWVLMSRAARLVAPDSDLQTDAQNIVASLIAGGFDQDAARWKGAVDVMDDRYGSPVWGMLALASPDTSGLNLGESRVHAFARRDDSVGKRRTALLVAGLAGLGRIDDAAARSLSREYSLALGKETHWTKLIDLAARRDQPGTVIVLAALALEGGQGAEVQPFYMYRLVRALRQTGQEYLARMIAAEALAKA